MEDILFEDITIYDSNSGMSIQQRSEGNITRVTFRNIRVETRYCASRWWGNGEPIWITSEQRDSNGALGFINGLQFINITARSENGAFISGQGVHPNYGHLISNVVLKDISLLIDHWSNYSQPHASFCNSEQVGPIDCRGSQGLDIINVP